MDYRHEILKLKEEKDALILAHNYQIGPIQDIADFVADSLGLAMKAQKVDNELIIMCGADFMAETTKILNPEKKVLIPSKDTRCPMALMLTKDWILKAKKKYPDAAVVLYVNSSAEAKAYADSCCTSANADKVVNSMKQKTVIFGPDRNLAYYVKQRSKKTIIPVPAMSYCYVHKQIRLKDVKKAKDEHPLAEVVVHPECNPDVQKTADKIASTSGMLKYCKESKSNEFIIGTEIGLLHRLERENPGKIFYPACDEAICIQQKDITMEKLYLSLKLGQFEIEIPKEMTERAASSINRMLEIL